MSGPGGQLVGVGGIVFYAPKPVPEPPPPEPEPPRQLQIGVRTATSNLDDCAATLLAIDQLACAWPAEFGAILHAVPNIRRYLTARGASFPSDLSFTIGISEIGGDAGLG